VKYVTEFFHWLGKPFRALGSGIYFLLNLTTQQMRALFSLVMLGGMVVLSLVNVWYSYRAEGTVEKGHEYHSFFELIQEQLRFNSGLIAWFALIMGLIVFGAEVFRAKMGDKEVEIRRGTKDDEELP
jgi:hypothetical protein